MAQWSQASGAAGHIYLDISEVATDPYSNTSTVRVRAWVTISGSTHNTYSMSWSVGGTWNWSGSWTMPGSGYREFVLLDAYATAGRNPDGSGYVVETFTIGASNTSGLGGPTAVSGTAYLQTLVQPPGKVTNVRGTRVDDSTITVSWTNNYASNGVPTATGVNQSINGAAWSRVATFDRASSINVPTAPNRKTTYQVVGHNSAGSQPASDASPPVYTTPSPPSNVTAARSDLNIVLNWANTVGYSEYETYIYHGVVQANGTVAWDGAEDGWTYEDAMAVVASGLTTYTHVSPDPSKVHAYTIGTRSTATPRLLSLTTTRSNHVQLLTAPNAPTVAPLPRYTDWSTQFWLEWTHNPVDSSPQTASEVQYSIDGGQTWAGSGKQAGNGQRRGITVTSDWVNMTALYRVRTWGQATTGGSDGAGASPWSSAVSTTFKTRPVVTITAPGSVVYASQVTVSLEMTQAEGATPVQATISLWQGDGLHTKILLEELTTTTFQATTLNTRLNDGEHYTLEVVATDSFGLIAYGGPKGFDVEYLAPPAAVVETFYTRETGTAQIDVTIPEAGPGEAAPVALTITRTINGVTETVVDKLEVAPGKVSILDTTPTIHGANSYVVTLWSADGASTPVGHVLTTAEDRWAIVSAGPGFAQTIAFWGSLELGASPSRQMALLPTAGRARPIALFGREGGLAVTGTAKIVPGEGATPEQIEAFVLSADRVCYRDPSGRRMFGAFEASISGRTGLMASLSYTVTEAE